MSKQIQSINQRFNQKWKTMRRDSIPDRPNFKMIIGKPFEWISHHIHFTQWILPLGLALSLSILLMSVSSAQGGPGFIRQVRALEADKTGLQNPAGLAFSSRANAFYVLEEPGQLPPAATAVIKLTPFGNQRGLSQIAAQINDPINTAFDNKAHRLLLLQFPANQLLEVREGLLHWGN